MTKHIRWYDVVLIVAFVLGLSMLAEAGTDFRYMAGHGQALRSATAQYVAGVQAKSREQAQVAYERIQQILRDLPDSSRNSELLAEYTALIEQLRRTGEANKTITERVAQLTAESGAHIVTIVTSRRIK